MLFLLIIFDLLSFFIFSQKPNDLPKTYLEFTIYYYYIICIITVACSFENKNMSTENSFFSFLLLKKVYKLTMYTVIKHI